MKKLIYLIALLPILQPLSLAAQQLHKSRAIILTDIGADPDDTESLVRLLLYSNEIDIQGLIATTSVWQKSRVNPNSIKAVINAYGKVQPNLLKHELGFPDASTLLKGVKHGLPVYGMKGVGSGKDSPGSEWIIKVLEEPDQRPLWVCAWGGTNTLAQALYKIRATKPKAEAAKLISKLRIHAISDQDDSGIWIRNNFPKLFYIVCPGDDYGKATWPGINSRIKGIDNTEISNKWLAKNIQQGHGPLGAVYPDVAYGMEGDTPSWLSLIPNGLNAPEHPNWGGWGGRYELYKPDFASEKKGISGLQPEPETRKIWSSAVDSYTPYVYNAYGRAVRQRTTTFTGNQVTVWRWRNDFQNDFAARMAWCTEYYKEANHPPVPHLAMPDHITVKSGAGFDLDATGSTDPDGDSLSYLWFNYPEAGTYNKLIKIDSAPDISRVHVIAPMVDKTVTAHFIVRVTDKGSPPLSRYKRVIVTITPK